jgi:hypothetical protein
MPVVRIATAARGTLQLSSEARSIVALDRNELRTGPAGTQNVSKFVERVAAMARTLASVPIHLRVDAFGSAAGFVKEPACGQYLPVPLYLPMSLC